jgi:GNAT superfamily N-acetyltransferase
MSETSIEIHRAGVDDWASVRAIRLRALAEAPLAFITTVEEARAFPDGVWRERAAASAVGRSQATMLATSDGAVVGLAIGLDRSDVRPGVVAIVSVFVSPHVRRRGVARRLMVAVEDWARRIGAGTTSLWVVEGNDEARSFYESIGYRATLDRQRIDAPPVRWEVRMVKDLTDD